ncbi:hypothetical protein [Methanobrevibacter sp.]|uniref:zinc ribbon domain-containing protein n=1 Tax=Methanobrevibacter sp. TaxID=66852 RepID=UPI00389113AF
MTLKGLGGYTRTDREKKLIIERLTKRPDFQYKMHAKYQLMDAPAADFDLEEPVLKDEVNELICDYDVTPLTKFCPECGRKYPEGENFCLDCAEKLREIKSVDISSIDLNPTFDFTANNQYNNFSDILTAENLEKLTVENFDVNKIVLNIKRTAFKRLDAAVKDNGIYLDSLSIVEKIMLFTKAFVDVEYKSYGAELGYYRFNRIYVDDRQLDALQITTMLHELAHFLIKEIITHVLCTIWECSKTTEIESVATFILSYSPVTALVDEYAAHTVEGRFTLYGFQDYSSFLNIEKSVELEKSEIEMLKTIGNTFANIIKKILESFIDAEMLSEIKDQFRRDILDQPDYRNLIHENCTLLNRKGMVEAIRLLLVEGFVVSMDNAEKLESYNEMW